MESNIARSPMCSFTLLDSTYAGKIGITLGLFEALGENADNVLDCEKISILITTTNERKIFEVVEIEARNMSYVVQVEEFGVTF
ncbi:hypothetical protein V6N13_114100 [Hibiscus sabdariffa]